MAFNTRANAAIAGRYIAKTLLRTPDTARARLRAAAKLRPRPQLDHVHARSSFPA